jgi:hypothetical protein
MCNGRLAKKVAFCRILGGGEKCLVAFYAAVAAAGARPVAARGGVTKGHEESAPHLPPSSGRADAPLRRAGEPPRGPAAHARAQALLWHAPLTSAPATSCWVRLHENQATKPRVRRGLPSGVVTTTSSFHNGNCGFARGEGGKARRCHTSTTYRWNPGRKSL